MSSQTVLICGVYGTVETIVQLGLSLFVLLSTYCQAQLPETNRFFYLVNILYLSNAECQREYRIGLVEDSLPNGATITLNDTPFTASRTKVFAFIYSILGFLGLISSLHLLISVRCSSESKSLPGAAVRGFWGLLMTLTSFTDIVSTAIYLYDLPMTTTMAKLVSYIGASAVGFQGGTVTGTWSAATSFAGYFSRLVGFWLFRVIFLWKLILHAKNKITQPAEIDSNERQLQVEPRYKERRFIEPQFVESRFVESERRPVRYAYKRTSSLPHLYPDQVLMKQPQRHVSDLQKNQSGAYRMSRSEPCLDTIDSPVIHDENAKKIKLKFPSSLLSLPQRLEQIMNERERKMKLNAKKDDALELDGSNFSFGEPIERNDALQVWRELEVPKEARARRLTDTDIRLLSYNAEKSPVLRGAQPWSYTAELAGGHRMRDQLPPDEELPPVPVPDYTLHRRKPSIVHMTAGDTDPPSRLLKKRESSITTNDVLY